MPAVVTLQNVSAFKRIVRNPALGGGPMFIPSVSRQDERQTIKVLVGEAFVDREVPGFIHPNAVEVLPKGTVDMTPDQAKAMLLSPRWAEAGSKAKPPTSRPKPAVTVKPKDE